MELSAAVHEEITLLLVDARKGSAPAQERLYAHVYRELHRLAERQLRGDREHGGATSLVHEAFFKLSRAPTEFNDRQHFFATAARAMRQILIDRARERQAERRGGGVRAQTLDGVALEVSAGGHDEELLALNQALDQLAAFDPRLAQVVEMRFFGGLELSEIAPLLDVSERTLKRDWRRARAFLYQTLSGDGGATPTVLPET
ncbi:MAG TPA: ECF-type sigma factor [Xanthomonadales bacterium]|nr:ECF-type sigma factor [Xanthomonadales bacterium]